MLGFEFSLNTLNSPVLVLNYFFLLLIQSLYESESLPAYPILYYWGPLTFLYIVTVGHKNVLYLWFEFVQFLIFFCSFPVKCWLSQHWTP